MPPHAQKRGGHGQFLTTHGHRGKGNHKSPTYHSWASMLARCYSARHPRYAYYGGRGIKVCTRWHKFANFLKDMGERPGDMTLDRRDTNGAYKKSNCRWATVTQQNNNQVDEHPIVCGCGVDGTPCMLHPEPVPF